MSHSDSTDQGSPKPEESSSESTKELTSAWTNTYSILENEDNASSDNLDSPKPNTPNDAENLLDSQARSPPSETDTHELLELSPFRNYCYPSEGSLPGFGTAHQYTNWESPYSLPSTHSHHVNASYYNHYYQQQHQLVHGPSWSEALRNANFFRLQQQSYYQSQHHQQNTMHPISSSTGNYHNFPNYTQWQHYQLPQYYHHNSYATTWNHSAASHYHPQTSYSPVRGGPFYATPGYGHTGNGTTTYHPTQVRQTDQVSTAHQITPVTNSMGLVNSLRNMCGGSCITGDITKSVEEGAEISVDDEHSKKSESNQDHGDDTHTESEIQTRSETNGADAGAKADSNHVYTVNQVTVSLTNGDHLFSVPLRNIENVQKTSDNADKVLPASSSRSFTSSVMTSTQSKSATKYRRGSSHLQLFQTAPNLNPHLSSPRLKPPRPKRNSRRPTNIQIQERPRTRHSKTDYPLDADVTSSTKWLSLPSNLLLLSAKSSADNNVIGKTALSTPSHSKELLENPGNCERQFSQSMLQNNMPYPNDNVLRHFSLNEDKPSSQIITSQSAQEGVISESEPHVTDNINTVQVYDKAETFNLSWKSTKQMLEKGFGATGECSSSLYVNGADNTNGSDCLQLFETDNLRLDVNVSEEESFRSKYGKLMYKDAEHCLGTQTQPVSQKSDHGHDHFLAESPRTTEMINGITACLDMPDIFKITDCNQVNGGPPVENSQSSEAPLDTSKPTMNQFQTTATLANPESEDGCVISEKSNTKSDCDQNQTYPFLQNYLSLTIDTLTSQSSPEQATNETKQSTTPFFPVLSSDEDNSSYDGESFWEDRGTEPLASLRCKHTPTYKLDKPNSNIEQLHQASVNSNTTIPQQATRCDTSHEFQELEKDTNVTSLFPRNILQVLTPTSCPVKSPPLDSTFNTVLDQMTFMKPSNESHDDTAHPLTGNLHTPSVSTISPAVNPPPFDRKSAEMISDLHSSLYGQHDHHLITTRSLQLAKCIQYAPYTELSSTKPSGPYSQQRTPHNSPFDIIRNLRGTSKNVTEAQDLSIQQNAITAVNDKLGNSVTSRTWMTFHYDQSHSNEPKARTLTQRRLQLQGAASIFKTSDNHDHTGFFTNSSGHNGHGAAPYSTDSKYENNHNNCSTTQLPFPHLQRLHLQQKLQGMRYHSTMNYKKGHAGVLNLQQRVPVPDNTTLEQNQIVKNSDVVSRKLPDNQRQNYQLSTVSPKKNDPGPVSQYSQSTGSMKPSLEAKSGISVNDSAFANTSNKASLISLVHRIRLAKKDPSKSASINVSPALRKLKRIMSKNRRPKQGSHVRRSEPKSNELENVPAAVQVRPLQTPTISVKAKANEKLSTLFMLGQRNGKTRKVEENEVTVTPPGPLEKRLRMASVSRCKPSSQNEACWISSSRKNTNSALDDWETNRVQGSRRIATTNLRQNEVRELNLSEESLESVPDGNSSSTLRCATKMCSESDSEDILTIHAEMDDLEF